MEGPKTTPTPSLTSRSHRRPIILEVRLARTNSARDVRFQGFSRFSVGFTLIFHGFSTRFSPVQIREVPWVFRYLAVELAAMNVKMGVKVSNRARQAGVLPSSRPGSVSKSGVCTPPPPQTKSNTCFPVVAQKRQNPACSG